MYKYRIYKTNLTNLQQDKTKNTMCIKRINKSLGRLFSHFYYVGTLINVCGVYCVVCVYVPIDIFLSLCLLLLLIFDFNPKYIYFEISFFSF